MRRKRKKRAPSKRKVERLLNELSLQHTRKWTEELKKERKEKAEKEAEERVKMFEWLSQQGIQASVPLDTGEAGARKRKYPDTGG